MKAGGAGSIPDGVNSDRSVHSQALHCLLRDIGEAVFALNTTVVGLDAVEKKHQKPKTLDISWKPRDHKIAARKARKFIVESVLIRVSEAIYQFATALSKLARFEDTRAKWESKTSKSEKISTIASTVIDEDDYLIPAVVLLVHWRNRIVHVNSSAKLKPPEKQILIKNACTIAERYRGLNVSCLLNHFDNQRPTLKDVSSLIAMTINLARKIDAATQPQQNLTKDELDAWLEHYRILPMLEKIKAETAPNKYTASVRRLFQSKAPLLLDSYLAHYGTRVNRQLT